MDFNDYQKEAHKLADYPDVAVVTDELNMGDGLVLHSIDFTYPILGLVGETGEVAEKLKKVIRNKLGEYNKEDVAAIKKELGDVLWYVAELCSVFEIDMGYCAEENIEKLKDRKNRGVIKSSGDNR